jgi:carbon storage regulator
MARFRRTTRTWQGCVGGPWRRKLQRRRISKEEYMLVLSRKVKQTIRIGDDVVIQVLRITAGTVQIGIQAPAQTVILRAEVTDDEKHKAA